MTWRAIFRYNGRVEGGPKEIIREFPDHRPEDKDIELMEKEALRINGSIFINGWTVEWVEPLLEDEGEDDVT